ncbi:MAG: hypothetical protein WA672_09885 [Candidatus Angelobacter sp.]
MPVEGSDIVPTAMNTVDDDSTGCEEAVSRSDDRVRKMTEQTRGPSLSNQIHIANQESKRKPWKSRPVHQLSLQRRPENSGAFSATPGILFWKTRKQISLPFTFLMRTSIALCQTEEVNVVL